MKQDDMRSDESKEATDANKKDAPESAEAVSRRGVLRTALTVLSVAGGSALTPHSAFAQRPTDKSALLLKDPDLPSRINHLFDEIRKDKKVQKEFIENPSSIITTRILPKRPKKISPQRISNANRALYSILSNEGFRQWALDYNTEAAKKPSIDREKALADLAEAMAKHADPIFFHALLEDRALKVAEGPDDDDNVAVAVVVWVAVAVVVAAVAIPVIFWGVANLKGNAISVKDMRSVAEQMTAHAVQLRKSGKLAVHVKQ